MVSIWLDLRSFMIRYERGSEFSGLAKAQKFQARRSLTRILNVRSLVAYLKNLAACRQRRISNGELGQVQRSLCSRDSVTLSNSRVPVMADAKNAPQILQHVFKSLTCTVYDTLWIPSSARFVLLGSTARSTGTIQIYELHDNDLNKLEEVEKQFSFKCGTFGASDLVDRQLATGDFKGNLQIWDLERLYYPIFHCKAHDSIINAIDGIGGSGLGYGAPEIVTGARDGRVCVWDPRQKDDPVAAFEPERPEDARDCWAVAFGNSYNDEERCVAAGYDNGDIKLFDLRTGRVRWQATVKNGVCGIEFDRKDIKMNKLVATTLEANFHVYDMRTHHPERGYSCLTEKVAHGTTVWGVKHLPQNRDVFVTLGGDGSVSLYKYSYPDQRSMKDVDNRAYGVMGQVHLLASKNLATQPISGFNWLPDKEGLAVMGSFDQCVRVAVVTKLSKI